jgi:hypothetical protein
MGIFSNPFKKKVIDEKEVEHKAREWVSKDYQTFVKGEHPEEEEGFIGFYIKASRFSEKIFKIKASDKMKEKLRQSLLTTELAVTPDQVMSLTILTIVLPLIVLLPLAFIIYFAAGSMLFLVTLPLLPLIFAYFLYTYPNYYATVTKIRASDETVKIILYMVIYLRLNPQIEGAVKFAAAHSSGPIGRDLKKILWDLEVRKYISISEAVSSKIEKWLLWDKQFVESINLLQALSLETKEEMREKTLDKTLSFILESTHEKMKSYSTELRIPVTIIHTMGITLPLMGLIMFPMIAIFLEHSMQGITGYMIFGFIVFIPLINYFYLRRTISKRPGAFSYPDISDHPDLPPEGKFRITIGGKKRYVPVKTVAIIVTVMMLIPGLVYFSTLASDYFKLKGTEEWGQRIKIEYDNALYFMMYSISVIWAIGAGLVIYFWGQSSQRLKIRDDVKMIEDEFQIGLFRLGDVLSSGLPIESALEKTLEKYRQYKLEGSPMYAFFSTILRNIKQIGMTLKKAVFDKEYGAIFRYPSILIKDIMQIIVSAAEKSSAILSIAAKSISTFLMKAKDVENLLKDMLDEVSAAIKMQAGMIAPFICGIVASMATFIIQLLQKIADFLKVVEENFNMGGSFIHGATTNFGDMMGMVKIDQVIPATLFQLVVGIYMIQIVMILAYFQNGIRFGFDKTTRNVLIGKTLIKALIIYSVVLLIGLFITTTFMPAIGTLAGGGSFG